MPDIAASMPSDGMHPSKLQYNTLLVEQLESFCSNNLREVSHQFFCLLFFNFKHVCTGRHGALQHVWCM